MFSMKASRLMSWPTYLWYDHGICPPSNGVPCIFVCQSVTNWWPSGFSDGMRMTTIRSRISTVRASLAVASSYSRSFADCVAPISLA